MLRHCEPDFKPEFLVGKKNPALPETGGSCPPVIAPLSARQILPVPAFQVVFI